MHGLKHAPRAWFQRLHDFLLSVGFKLLETYTSLFYYSQDFAYVYPLVYVDDILIMSSDQNLVNMLLSKLYAAFRIRDLGEFFFLVLKWLSMMVDCCTLNKDI